MLAIFDADAGNFDVAVLLAAIAFVVAGVLALPGKDAPVKAFAASVGFFAAAVFSFAFPWLTP